MGDARLIRPMYDYPAGTPGVYTDHNNDDNRYYFVPQGSNTGWKVDVGRDIRLLKWQNHLYNGHDDVISACYWADRMLSNHYPKRVYLTHEGKYAIRTLTHPSADVILNADDSLRDYFTRHWRWQIAASWRPKPPGQFSIGGKWDFLLRADPEDLSNPNYDRNGYNHVHNDNQDFEHVLTELLVFNQIETYITLDDILYYVYLPETDSRGDMVDYAEIWITDTGFTHWRIK